MVRLVPSALQNSWIPSPSPSICYQYDWKLSTSEETKGTLILSNFIEIPGLLEDAFRLCAGTNQDNELIQISCYVNSIGLGHMSYRMTAVTINSGEGNTLLLEMKKVSNSSNQSCVLFRWDAMGLVMDTSGGVKVSLVLYLSGSVELYALCRVDIAHGQQLWNAAVGRQTTDVIFQVFDKTFAAHKFILAARSPVFRAMFDRQMMGPRTLRVNIIDVEDPDIFQQFLRFLYTGRLVKPVTKQLGILAEKYQVNALASICHEANAIDAAFHDGLMLTASSFNDLHKNLKTISRVGQVDQTFHGTLFYAEMFLVENAVQYIDKEPRWVNDKAFLLKFESSKDGSSTTVALYSSWANEPARWLSSVDLLVCKNDVVCQRIAMDPVLTDIDSTKQPLEVFIATLRNIVFHDPDMSCRFLIHRFSTVATYEYGQRDSLLGEELWTSAINKERTDVEFRVGDKIFSARRALLAARCPALAKLIPSETSPISPAIVQIGTTDPATFEDLLYFLYTGLIRKDSPDESLLEAAKSYRVETLALVLREKGSRKQMNQDEISQAIFLLG